MSKMRFACVFDLPTLARLAGLQRILQARKPREHVSQADTIAWAIDRSLAEIEASRPEAMHKVAVTTTSAYGPPPYLRPAALSAPKPRPRTNTHADMLAAAYNLVAWQRKREFARRQH